MKQEFVNLVNANVDLNNIELSDFERLVNRKPNKLAVAKTVALTTDEESDERHVPDIVVGFTDPVDGDDVPFAISDLATLASQPFLDDRSVSLETQCGDGAETVSSGAVSDTVTNGAAETSNAIGDTSMFASQPYYSYDSSCPSHNSRNLTAR